MGPRRCCNHAVEGLMLSKLGITASTGLRLCNNRMQLLFFPSMDLCRYAMRRGHEQ